MFDRIVDFFKTKPWIKHALMAEGAIIVGAVSTIRGANAGAAVAASVIGGSLYGLANYAVAIFVRKKTSGNASDANLNNDNTAQVITVGASAVCATVIGISNPPAAVGGMLLGTALGMGVATIAQKMGLLKKPLSDVQMNAELAEQRVRQLNLEREQDLNRERNAGQRRQNTNSGSQTERARLIETQQKYEQTKASSSQSERTLQQLKRHEYESEYRLSHAMQERHNIDKTLQEARQKQESATATVRQLNTKKKAIPLKPSERVYNKQRIEHHLDRLVKPANEKTALGR